MMDNEKTTIENPDEAVAEDWIDQMANDGAEVSTSFHFGSITIECKVDLEVFDMKRFESACWAVVDAAYGWKRKTKATD